MIKNLALVILLITAKQTSAMRAPLRAQAGRHQQKLLSRSHRATSSFMNANLPHRTYSIEREAFEQMEAEARRQEAWLRINVNVAERISFMKENAKRHRALAKRCPQNAYYARAYETLAELEKEKFELFKMTLDKLNAAALYFEEPNMETEVKLTQLLHDTYEEFYNALPKEDKLRLENKF